MVAYTNCRDCLTDISQEIVTWCFHTDSHIPDHGSQWLQATIISLMSPPDAFFPQKLYFTADNITFLFVKLCYLSPIWTGCCQLHRAQQTSFLLVQVQGGDQVEQWMGPVLPGTGMDHSSSCVPLSPVYHCSVPPVGACSTKLSWEEIGDV